MTIIIFTNAIFIIINLNNNFTIIPWLLFFPPETTWWSGGSQNQPLRTGTDVFRGTQMARFCMEACQGDLGQKWLQVVIFVKGFLEFNVGWWSQVPQSNWLHSHSTTTGEINSTTPTTTIMSQAQKFYVRKTCLEQHHGGWHFHGVGWCKGCWSWWVWTSRARAGSLQLANRSVFRNTGIPSCPTN